MASRVAGDALRRRLASGTLVCQSPLTGHTAASHANLGGGIRSTVRNFVSNAGGTRGFADFVSNAGGPRGFADFVSNAGGPRGGRVGISGTVNKLGFRAFFCNAGGPRGGRVGISGTVNKLGFRALFTNAGGPRGGRVSIFKNVNMCSFRALFTNAGGPLGGRVGIFKNVNMCSFRALFTNAGGTRGGRGARAVRDFMLSKNARDVSGINQKSLNDLLKKVLYEYYLFQEITFRSYCADKSRLELCFRIPLNIIKASIAFYKEAKEFYPAVATITVLYSLNMKPGEYVDYLQYWHVEKSEKIKKELKNFRDRRDGKDAKAKPADPERSLELALRTAGLANYEALDAAFEYGKMEGQKEAKSAAEGPLKTSASTASMKK